MFIWLMGDEYKQFKTFCFNILSSIVIIIIIVITLSPFLFKRLWKRTEYFQNTKSNGIFHSK